MISDKIITSNNLEYTEAAIIRVNNDIILYDSGTRPVAYYSLDVSKANNAYFFLITDGQLYLHPANRIGIIKLF